MARNDDRSPLDATGPLRSDYEAVDWAATGLGDPTGWAPELRQTVEQLLPSRFAVLVCWGRDLRMVYNDAYVELIGDKHPAALGARVEDVFPETWDALAPLFERVWAGETVDFTDLPLVLRRRGFLEEVHFTFCYSPVRDARGEVVGVVDLSVETNRQVLDHRRLELLTRLGDVATDLESAPQLPDRALDVLRTDPADLAEVDLLLPGRALAVLPPPPRRLAPREVLVDEAPRDPDVGRLAWARVPGALGGGDAGVLAVRLNPRLAVDESYRDFLRLVAATVGDALSAAASYVAERERAERQARYAEQLRALVDVAQTLPDAEDEVDVLRVLSGGAPRLLGCDGVVLGVLGHGEGTEARHERWQVLGDADDPAVPLLSRALEAADGHVVVQDAGGLSLGLRLQLGERTTGALGLSWRVARPAEAVDVELASALAASTAQAVDRVRARRAERQAAAEVRTLAETLQRSLLTSAPQPRELDVAVRYLPAAEHAQVGGDWHDAFRTAAGTTCLVIGDVTGHDQEAAAAMGQVRNLLRGIGYSLDVSPASALSALDRAMRDLGVDALATGVLATLEPAAGSSGWLLRWSNAGHPPPLVVSPEGVVELLRPEADLLLGLDAEHSRADHVHGLPVGSTVLLYTDGLVERRGASIDDGLDWLRDVAAGWGGMTPDDLCDEALRLVQGEAEDDVAVLAVRVREDPGAGGADVAVLPGPLPAA